MRLPEARRLASVIPQGILVISAEGRILALNAAAARAGAGLREGRRLQEAVADGDLESRLRDWLRQGGPIPGRLDIRDGGEAVRHRVGVARVTLDGDPVLIVRFSQGESQHRLAQLTDQLQAANRESRYRRAAEEHREEALAAEREARQRIERLQALTSAMAAALRVEDAIEAIEAHAADVVGAQRVIIEVRDAGAGWRGLDRETPAAVGPSTAPASEEEPPRPLLDAIERGEPLLFETPERLAERYPGLAADVRDGFLGMALPLTVTAGEEPIGALGFVFDPRKRLSSEDMTPCRLIASQSAQALERARLYDREHRFAETLQRALLPRSLPLTEGIECAVRYLPAAEERVVGGDWYDVIPLGGARVGLAVGDVAGHGPSAATAMGQMRNALRALATTIPSPATVLEAFNAFVCGQLPEEMATVVYLVVDTAAGTLTYANAGHLPPLLVGADGDPAFLEAGLGPPIGVGVEYGYADERRGLPPQSRLVVYTDGLVERRERAIDEGLEQLRRVSRSQSDPDSLCDALLSHMVAGVRLQDDAAVLVASVSRDAGDPRGTFGRAAETSAETAVPGRGAQGVSAPGGLTAAEWAAAVAGRPHRGGMLRRARTVGAH